MAAFGQSIRRDDMRIEGILPCLTRSYAKILLIPKASATSDTSIVNRSCLTCSAILFTPYVYFLPTKKASQKDSHLSTRHIVFLPQGFCYFIHHNILGMHTGRQEYCDAAYLGFKGALYISLRL
jgi:hypothetical protein